MPLVQTNKKWIHKYKEKLVYIPTLLYLFTRLSLLKIKNCLDLLLFDFPATFHLIFAIDLTGRLLRFTFRIYPVLTDFDPYSESAVLIFTFISVIHYLTARFLLITPRIYPLDSKVLIESLSPYNAFIRSVDFLLKFAFVRFRLTDLARLDRSVLVANLDVSVEQ